MTVAQQLTWDQLVAIARRVGVKVVEAPSSHRGQIGRMGSVVGVTCHHTGTANSYSPSNEYPDYNVVKEGRTGLINSLSAYGLGRYSTIYVFSEFLSWHAGTWDWQGITDGNGHFLGIECAGVGDYTEFQRKVYPRLVAAILLEIGSPRTMAPRHLDGAMPRGRKSDAANMDGNFYQGKPFYWWVDYFMANPAYINVNYAPAADKKVEEDNMFFAYRNAPQYGGTGAIFLGAPGVWKPVYNMQLLGWYQHLGLIKPGVGGAVFTDISPAQFEHLGHMFTAGEAVPTPPSNIL